MSIKIGDKLYAIVAHMPHSSLYSQLKPENPGDPAPPPAPDWEVQERAVVDVTKTKVEVGPRPFGFPIDYKRVRHEDVGKLVHTTRAGALEGFRERLARSAADYATKLARVEQDLAWAAGELLK